MLKHRYSKFLPFIFLVSDFICLNVSIVIANILRFSQPFYFDENYGYLHIFLNIVWILIFYFVKLNESNRESNIIDVINSVLLALVINLSVVFTAWVASKSYFYSREHLFVTFLSFGFLIISWRIVFYYVIRIYRKKGYNLRNVIVVGWGESSQNMIDFLGNNPGIGYRFHGCFDNNTSTSSKSKILGKVSDVNKYVIEKNVDLIFCNLSKLDDDEFKSILDFAENNLIKVKIISRFSSMSNRNLSIQRYGDIPVIRIGNIPLDNAFNRFIKRAFDVIFSSIVIVFLLSWLIPLIGLLIKFESRGPVFFKQLRNGRGNHHFKIYKFRTMIVHEDEKVEQAKKNDNRITKLGSFLRKTSLDELPQFINVFLGEMSIVGPRPHAIPHNEEYQGKIDRFIQRHAVKPGITGLAQAKGYRGETAHFNEMYGRVKLDKFYVKNWSLLLDFKIIGLTIFSILKGQETAY